MFIKELLKQSAKDGRLSHAYLFWGQGQAKLDLALSLASYLETNLWHPQRHRLIDGRVFDEGSIGEARAVRRWLWQKPFKSSRRTAIIDVAEGELTAEAQNALLKVTEEPPPAGLILLIINDPGRLWSTLASRFQKIYMPQSGRENLETKKEKELVNQYLESGAVQRKNLIKEILEIDAKKENDAGLRSFVRALMLELDNDPIGNFPLLKELSHRWTLINQLNVNKRLQLEAVTAVS